MMLLRTRMCSGFCGCLYELGRRLFSCLFCFLIPEQVLLLYELSVSMLTREQIVDLAGRFSTVSINYTDKNGSTRSNVDESGCGTIPVADVQEALKIAGIDLPGFQFRELMKRYGSAKDLAFDDFQNLFTELRSERDQEVNEWKQRIGSVTGAYTVKGLSKQSNEEIVHTIRVEEEVAFSNWINSNLCNDTDLKNLVPCKTALLYGNVSFKLINLAVPDTIDERAINKKHLNTYTKLENLTLALMSAQAIGCNIVNIDGDDLSKGKPHLVLGLLWQIIRIGLFNQIDLRHVPGLFRLLQEGETLDDLRKLSPEQILIRWVNYHLAKVGLNRTLTNFTADVIDSEIYTYLLSEIAPKATNVSLYPLSVKIDCREFVAPNDVAQGNYKLNLAFVANLFNKYPSLPEPGADEFEIDAVDETREEKTYRNWMNSMGVDPHVNWLYSDLCSGVIIFQLYDIIRPGIVNWKRVVKKFSKLKGMMDQIQNCNYAVELGKQLRFSLVGIQGKDIYDGNQTLTLALVWQLMRAYTLTVLAQCTQSGDSLATDKEIIAWVNKKVRSMNDPTISDACVVLDLIESIKPGTISYSLVKTGTAEDNLENAKYAITSGRKIGAKIYALPEDIVEVKPRMVMTVFACLMARDYTPNAKEMLSPVEPPENHG
uniref:Calponin-homology (CH) domain-containing protein n=1 Tax=Wuchereria bancrofti TaxID=6293 RepID=A0A1I8EPS5_WUCBA